MRLFFSLTGLGFGLATGVALVYYAVSNPLVLVVLIGLAMLILGMLISGAMNLINNRQWTRMLGEIMGSQRYTTNNKYSMETRPYPFPIPGQFRPMDDLPRLQPGQQGWNQQQPGFFPPVASMYDYEQHDSSLDSADDAPFA